MMWPKQADGYSVEGAWPSLEGEMLGGYRLIEQIGCGGMAVIYRAYDPLLERYVAIKTLAAELGQDPSFSARFRVEARSAAQLQHPNILPIYGFGDQDGVSYLVMQLVKGGTLQDLLGAPIDAQAAVGLIAQIADALYHAHQQGIVHRDVKPTNVLMARHDWPLLSDFGIAHVLMGSTSLTRTGQTLLGTPHYMAPEQVTGAKISPATDQYALGVILYEMLTGTTPFGGQTSLAIAYQHLYARVPRLRERNPEIPPRLEEVLLKALAKHPSERHRNLAVFRATLLESVGDSVVTDKGTAPQTSSRSPLRWIRVRETDDARTSIPEKLQRLYRFRSTLRMQGK